MDAADAAVATDRKDWSYVILGVEVPLIAPSRLAIRMTDVIWKVKLYTIANPHVLAPRW